MSKIQKFRLISNGAVSEPYTLEDLVLKRLEISPGTTAVQYLGFSDGQQDLYEGDVIKLAITEKLMDKKTNTFYNSNLGKYLSAHPEITAVYLAFDTEKERMGCHYSVYFAGKNGIEKDEDGKLESQYSGTDSLFPVYLCQKGAKYEGSLVTSPHLLHVI